ncbi:hypothetical protein ACFYXF_27570 [Streptomyces sp. NPDC002680]|uniref:hypothetical protein n=1 Tax=Streptomyces sp. NPDC002680 TaxID=3364659 RepID=UPI00369BF847
MLIGNSFSAFSRRFSGASSAAFSTAISSRNRATATANGFLSQPSTEASARRINVQSSTALSTARHFASSRSNNPSRDFSRALTCGNVHFFLSDRQLCLNGLNPLRVSSTPVPDRQLVGR